jgi:hypothetical protein
MSFHLTSSSSLHLNFLVNFINLPSVSANFFFLTVRQTKIFHGFQGKSLPGMVLPPTRNILSQLSSVTFSGALLFAPQVGVSCINISHLLKN